MKQLVSFVTRAPLHFGYRRTLSSLLILSLLLVSLTVTPALAAGQTYFNYTVVSGDTLYLISLRYGTTVNALTSINGLTSTNLRVGQVLKIPNLTANSCRVRAGDTLYIIAQRFGTTVSGINTANGLTSEMIYPGQTLILPDSSIYVEYLVQSGDTLYIISLKFQTTVAELKSLNQLTSEMLNVGQALRVPRVKAASPTEPAAGKYTVKSGDTLYILAGKYGTTVQRIMELNSLTSTNLNVGQSLLIPGYDPSKEPAAPVPPTASWTVPSGTVLVHVASGQCLWDLTQKYKTSQAAITATNHLHTDMLQYNQPLFVPLNSTTPVTVTAPSVPYKTGYGEWLDWEYVNWIFDTCSQAVVRDLATGREFNVKRYGGSNHADCEPLTQSDTDVMKSIYGGTWTWERRAVLVRVGGRVFAGSMAGMPHGTESIAGNGFEGMFDLHFLNSRTHNTNQIDTLHQAMVQKAAGY
ncbi:MAG: LysM peptidoglycan-binding domain-containing protein [Firmicutes bacterium]|nr:LysM peptidoglycan-binding domain-containing protein [Bacillota bacterium]